MKLMSKIKEISVGWFNYLTANKEVQPLSKRKADVCRACPLNYHGICSPTREGEAVVDFIYNDEQRYKGVVYNGCGCPLKAKQANPDSKCPLGKFEDLV
jgi:hypothetical protein